MRGNHEAGPRLKEAVARIAELTRGRQATGMGHEEADAIAGSVASDDAAGFDPLPVLAALAGHGARAVVIGQVAGILQGSKELTGDLDLLWSGEPGDAGPMAAAFVELRAELFDDDHVPIPDPAEAFSLSKVLFRARTASGDCCTPRLPWGPIDVRPFIDRAESTRVDGVLVRYLRLEDLAAMRRAAGRAKDLRRLAEMEGFGRLGQPN